MYMCMCTYTYTSYTFMLCTEFDEELNLLNQHKCSLGHTTITMLSYDL